MWHNFRGLAMARSIGDHNAKAVGVIAEPEVRLEHLAPPWRMHMHMHTHTHMQTFMQTHTHTCSMRRGGRGRPRGGTAHRWPPPDERPDERRR